MLYDEVSFISLKDVQPLATGAHYEAVRVCKKRRAVRNTL